MTSPQPPGTPTAPSAGAPAPGTSAPPAGSADAPPPGALAKDESTALQLALRAENAALWAYALVAASDADDADVIAQMSGAHLQRRDATAARMTAGGAKPAAPAAAYSTPAVTDVATARTLAITIENDCAAAWKNVVASTDSADLRSFGTGGLTEAAVRLVEWKQLAKIDPITVPFPGGS